VLFRSLERSIVIVTSDHGEEFWDHDDFEHGHTQYEELVKVPLLVGFPGGEHAGAVIEEPVRLMDLMPTAFDRAGLKRPATFQGESFLGLLSKDRGPKPEEAPLLFESCLYGEERKALRAGRWKLIRNEETGAKELFDLEADPSERMDLSAEQARIVESLDQALDALLEANQSRAGGGRSAVDLPDELKEALQGLGYAQ